MTAKRLGHKGCKVGIEANCPWIHVARARLVANFRKYPCEYLFFRDDDIHVDASVIQSLIDMKADCAIAPYNIRDTSRFDVVFDDQGNVAWAGLGCALIHRSVIEKLWNAHFAELHFYEEVDGAEELRVGMFRDEYADVDGVRRLLMEDHAFWYRARVAGFAIHALDGAVVTHAGVTTTFTPNR